MKVLIILATFPMTTELSCLIFPDSLGMQKGSISVTTTVFIRLCYPVCEDISLLETVSDVAMMCCMKHLYRHHEIQLKSMTERVKKGKKKNQISV